MLRYQLNPHFLFNTLNSITHPGAAEADRAGQCDAHAPFQRSCATRWSMSPAARSTLSEEIETLKLYLDIERMRFEERLRTEFRIEHAAAPGLAALAAAPAAGRERDQICGLAAGGRRADQHFRATRRATGFGSPLPIPGRDCKMEERARTSRPQLRVALASFLPPVWAWRTFATASPRPMARITVFETRTPAARRLHRGDRDPI